jgi:Predicted peptidyl-prolyl cis-trans isomerase (rotamase), cyclophilin family
MERESIVKSAAITNLETELEEGNQVYTYVQVEPNPQISPISGTLLCPPGIRKGSSGL